MKRLPLAILCTAIICEVVVFYVSVQPLEQSPLLFAGQDKVIHFAVYALLGILLVVGSATGGRGYIYGGGILGGVFTGVVSEFLQQQVPLRTASFWDALANLLGLLIVIAIYEAVHLWRGGGIIYAETLPPSKERKVEDEGQVSDGS